MKVEIYSDEAYPVYGLLIPSGPAVYSIVEISEEFFAEYKRVSDLYDEMQSKLEELYPTRSRRS